jgi:hypothetical protein
MLVTLLLNLIVAIIGAVFSNFPVVTTLPTIVGYDIDSALVNGVGYVYTYIDAFWYLKLILEGFFVLTTYYALKISLRFILGSRTPAQ